MARQHKSWTPDLKTAWLREDDRGTHFILELAGPREATESLGCPARLLLEVDFPTSDRVVQLNFQWFEKNASRLTEALWLSICPRISDPDGWVMDKMGQRISPLEVIRNGNRKLHALGTDVRYHDQGGQFIIESLDAPLVAPGETSLLDFNNRQPPLKKGMHFNLFNNIFATNFPTWLDEDGRFRFVLRCSS